MGPWSAGCCRVACTSMTQSPPASRWPHTASGPTKGEPGVEVDAILGWEWVLTTFGGLDSAAAWVTGAVSTTPLTRQGAGLEPRPG